MKLLAEGEWVGVREFSDAPMRIGDDNAFWFKIDTYDGAQGWVYGAFLNLGNPQRRYVVPVENLPPGGYSLKKISIGESTLRGTNAASAYLSTKAGVDRYGVYFSNLDGSLADFAVFNFEHSTMQRSKLRTGEYLVSYSDGSCRSHSGYLTLLESEIVLTVSDYACGSRSTFSLTYSRNYDGPVQVEYEFPEEEFTNRHSSATDIALYASPSKDSQVLAAIPKWNIFDFSVYQSLGIDLKPDWSDLEMMRIARQHFSQVDRSELPAFRIVSADLSLDTIMNPEIWFTVRYNGQTGYVFTNMSALSTTEDYWKALNVNLFGL